MLRSYASASAHAAGIVIESWESSVVAEGLTTTIDAVIGVAGTISIASAASQESGFYREPRSCRGDDRQQIRSENASRFAKKRLCVGIWIKERLRCGERPYRRSHAGKW